MNMSRFSIICAVASALLCCLSCKSDKEAFIDDLISKMTLEQKIGQLNQLPMPSDIVTGPEVRFDFKELIRSGRLGSVLNVAGAEKVRALQRFAVDSSDLHIPLLFGLDIVHGYVTQMPIPLGVAATWDPSNAELCARISAIEATADGTPWTFAPMVDVTHDSRWGRISEGAGEDPYLGSRFAEAYVRGFQGDFSGKKDQMAATVKHFALYGAPVAGLDYMAADMSRGYMYNYYMAPYKAAVDAGAVTVMTAFNEVEGVPCSANEYLLQDVLRKEWGFEGLIFSDYNCVMQMVNHGMGDRETVTARTMNAGLDVDMSSEFYDRYLSECVRKGLVREKTVERACRRVLSLKYDLGLFDDPYRFCREQERDSITCHPEFLAVSRKMAHESFVLLKNEDELLPLERGTKVALVGPFVNETRNLMGNWQCRGKYSPVISLAEGLSKADPGNVVVEPGCDICLEEQVQKYWCRWMQMKRLEGDPEYWKRRALKAARESDVVIAAMGEPALLSGEAASRADLTLPDAQKELLKDLVATGKPVVLLVIAGRPMDLSWENDNVAAILNVWYPGSQSAEAIADVLYGDASPGGRLPVSFPKHVGQMPYFYNHTPSGNPYRGNHERPRSTYLDLDDPAPLYPFGYGLDYTTYDYSEPEVTVCEDSVIVKTIVTNTGDRTGSEVVQLYLRDVAASVARPVTELKRFEKVVLEPGQASQIVFTLGRDDMSYFDNDLNFIFEPGKFIARIGGNCRDVKSTSFMF